jgi:hypothetical protein
MKLRSGFSFKALFLAVVAATLPTAAPKCAVAGTITYDLAADWSDTNNPNGPWSYRQSPTTVLTSHFSDYDPTRTIWTSAQPAWANSTFPNIGHVPLFMKAVATTTSTFSSWDMPIGRVYLHGNNSIFSPAGFANEPAGFFWTAPVAGTVQISGDMWIVRPLDAPPVQDWALVVNGFAVSTGTLSASDGTSAAPLNLSTGTGGLAALAQTVNVGDVIDLQFIDSGSVPSGTLIGVDLTLNETTSSAVPEPSSLLVFAGLGAVTCLGAAFRRRKRMTTAEEHATASPEQC